MIFVGHPPNHRAADFAEAFSSSVLYYLDIYQTIDVDACTPCKILNSVFDIHVLQLWKQTSMYKTR